MFTQGIQFGNGLYIAVKFYTHVYICPFGAGLHHCVKVNVKFYRNVKCKCKPFGVGPGAVCMKIVK